MSFFANDPQIKKEGIIYTSPINVGILDVITHRKVMMLAKQLGLEIYEKEFTLFNVCSADEYFLYRDVRGSYSCMEC